MPGKGWLRGRDIGRGSTATVFLANSIASGDVFAIKSTEFSHSALLQREQSILSALVSPAIISCLGFDVAPRDGGALFYNLFLEFAPGGSLSDHIKRRGRFLDEVEIGSKIRDILEGLSYLHGRGIVHCDVKPANVLIGSGGRAKIGDLGCARWIASGEPEVRGTPIYMAPEVVRGEEQGMSADIWSLGCAVIEMVTGQPPWTEICDVLASIRRIGFSGDVPEIPAWLTADARDFLGKCLRRNPEERWTAEELLQHPFVSDSICAELRWVSPKSTLDLRLWESMEEEEDEVAEKGEGFPTGGIRELAVVSGNPNWTWGHEEWLVVRNGAYGESAVEAESPGSGDGMAGGRWNADDAAASSSGGGDDEDAVIWKVGNVSSSEIGQLEEADGCKMLRLRSLGGGGGRSVTPLSLKGCGDGKCHLRHYKL
ncbi:Mitogen-activated protein kinase kinase kinase ANP1 [Platanthera guangdongensis]|uniref:Mitogen-activated protein kinase kinase kinase ANP1 n=1 Tax=Platanthera guangdongensis TaxID=2320717 RepID=A0ABR2MQC1_9ASPA